MSLTQTWFRLNQRGNQQKELHSPGFNYKLRGRACNLIKVHSTIRVSQVTEQGNEIHFMQIWKTSTYCSYKLFISSHVIFLQFNLKHKAFGTLFYHIPFEYAF